jgi:hypothetical protein
MGESMIISASRRTDIPAYYSDWFFNRIKEGHVLVKNPRNIHQVRRISLSHESVDGIVFWTKNPIHMIPRLEELRDFAYYFQFTLNAYGNDIEINLPTKKEFIIPAFQKLSKAAGKDRVVWRYDPILFNDKYNYDYHAKYFEVLGDKLSGYTDKCIFSFLDRYKSINKNLDKMGITEPSISQKEELAHHMSEIAKSAGIQIDTCAEDIDLSRFGIGHAKCIDKERLERIGNFKLKLGKDKGQRAECGCYSSVDIGAYNTCNNGCIYCYAN